MSPTLREYTTTLLVTATVTFLLTSVVRRLAIRIGAVPPARDRDVHAVPIPRMGGLAMYLGLAAGLYAASQMSPLKQVFVGTGLTSGLLLAGGLIVIVGIIDDRWGLPAVAKLSGQIAAGAVLVASGAQLTNFPIPNGQLFSLTPDESVVLTILVVVATINAVNFIDGLDGLAAGIVCISAISFFLYYYSLAKAGGLSAEGTPALAAVLLAGACVGFLPHNFNPARIFMGDTGSMLLGLLLAYVPISAISSLDYMALPTTANRFPEILPLLLPAAVLVIPYTDMLRAVIRRTRAGQSPFAADRKHLHHQMLAVGHSHRSSVLILYAWAALFSGTVVILSIVKTPLLVLAATTAAAVLVLALLSMPKLRWWERNAAPEPAGPPAKAAVPLREPALAAAFRPVREFAAAPSAGPLSSAGPLPSGGGFRNAPPAGQPPWPSGPIWPGSEPWSEAEPELVIELAPGFDSALGGEPLPPAGSVPQPAPPFAAVPEPASEPVLAPEPVPVPVPEPGPAPEPVPEAAAEPKARLGPELIRVARRGGMPASAKPRFVPNPLSDPLTDPLGVGSKPRFVPRGPGKGVTRPRFIPAAELPVPDLPSSPEASEAPQSESPVTQRPASEPVLVQPAESWPAGVTQPGHATARSVTPGPAQPAAQDAHESHEAQEARPIARASGMIIP